MNTKKTQIKSFKEFIEDIKKDETKKNDKKIDWEERKIKWLKSIDKLYEKVDEIIVLNLENSGYQVNTEKEEVKNFEDYIGSYTFYNYFIKTEIFDIKFFPIGTLIIGSLGRVNMILSKETIKIVLSDWGIWKIVTRFGNSTKLIDFNEHNIVKIFQENT